MKSFESTQPALRLRIGILQTDNVVEEFREEFGDYPGMFVRLLESANRQRAQPHELTIDSYVSQDHEFPDVQAYDAYLITGSRHSVYEDLPWIKALVEFVTAALSARRKLIGICFGHQLLAHYFGGETTAAASGWTVGVQRTRLLCDEPWMEPGADEVGLLSSHKDQVVKLPQNACVIASSAQCPNAGFTIGDQVLTLQGHPEFSKGYSAALMEKREELLGAETFDRGMASLAEDTHEQIVASWILNFLSRESA